MAMIAQRFDHPAVGGDPAAAAPDDAGQFVAKQRHLLDLVLDLRQMAARDPVGLAAIARRVVREVEQ